MFKSKENSLSNKIDYIFAVPKYVYKVITFPKLCDYWRKNFSKIVYN